MVLTSILIMLIVCPFSRAQDSSLKRLNLFDEETDAIKQRTKRTKPVLEKPDRFGNWTVATSEVTIERAGQSKHFVEIQTRVITYY